MAGDGLAAGNASPGRVQRHAEVWLAAEPKRWISVIAPPSASSAFKPAWPSGPPFGTARAVVVDDTTGDVLLETDAASAAPIASMTKPITAMVVLGAGQDLREPLRIDHAGRCPTVLIATQFQSWTFAACKNP